MLHGRLTVICLGVSRAHNAIAEIAAFGSMLPPG